jgi:hypothetical protein
VLILLASFSLVVTSRTALARDFWVENKTPYEMYVAVGYLAEKGTYQGSRYPVDRSTGTEDREADTNIRRAAANEWVAEGYFKVVSGQSRRVYSGPQSRIFLRVQYVDAKWELFRFQIDRDPKSPYNMTVKEGGWWVDGNRDHRGYRLCQDEETKAFSLRYSNERYAVLQSEIPGNRFDAHYPGVKSGATSEQVECEKEVGFYELTFKTPMPKYRLRLVQMEGDGLGYTIRPEG